MAVTPPAANAPYSVWREYVKQTTGKTGSQLTQAVRDVKPKPAPPPAAPAPAPAPAPIRKPDRAPISVKEPVREPGRGVPPTDQIVTTMPVLDQIREKLPSSNAPTKDPSAELPTKSPSTSTPTDAILKTRQAWQNFSEGWPNLPPEDKDWIRRYWPKAGTGSAAREDFRRNLTELQQQGLGFAVKDSKLEPNERTRIRNRFPLASPGGGGGDGGTGGGDTTDGGTDAGTSQEILQALTRIEKRVTDIESDIKDIKNKQKSLSNEIEDIGNILDDVSTGGGGGGGTQEGAEDAANDNPTTVGGGTTIYIPGPDEKADTSIPDESQRIFMPGIDRRITREVERITLSLVESAQDFIEGGIDYGSIDYVPQKEVFSEDDLVFFDPSANNVADFNENSLSYQLMNSIYESILELLTTGDITSSSFNYEDFLNLFELKYRSDGTPSLALKVELTGFANNSIRAIIVSSDENDVVVEEGEI